MHVKDVRYRNFQASVGAVIRAVLAVCGASVHICKEPCRIWSSSLPAFSLVRERRDRDGKGEWHEWLTNGLRGKEKNYPPKHLGGLWGNPLLQGLRMRLSCHAAYPPRLQGFSALTRASAVTPPNPEPD